MWVHASVVNLTGHPILKNGAAALIIESSVLLWPVRDWTHLLSAPLQSSEIARNEGLEQNFRVNLKNTVLIEARIRRDDLSQDLIAALSMDTGLRANG